MKNTALHNKLWVITEDKTQQQNAASPFPDEWRLSRHFVLRSVGSSGGGRHELALESKLIGPMLVAPFSSIASAGRLPALAA